MKLENKLRMWTERNISEYDCECISERIKNYYSKIIKEAFITGFECSDEGFNGGHRNFDKDLFDNENVKKVYDNIIAKNK